MASINDIPPEVQLNIFRRVDRRTQKKLRLVRACYPAATTVLFEEYSLALTPKLVSKFRKFARTRFAQQVRKLVVYGDELEQITEHQAYEGELSDETEALHKRGIFFYREDEYANFTDPTQELRDIWQQYEDLDVDQQKWKDNVHGKTFSNALCALKKMQHVTLLAQTDDSLPPKWLEPRELRDILLHGDAEKWFTTQISENHHDMYGYAVPVLLKALSARSRLPNVMQVVNLELQMNVGWDYSLKLDTAELSVMLVNLRKLDICYVLDRMRSKDDDYDGTSQLEPQLGDMLVAASQLTHLGLRNGYYYRHDRYPLDIFKTPSHSHLTRLSLSTYSRVINLDRFLRKHAATLKCLSLECAKVDNLLEMLAMIPVTLNLEQVFMRALVDATGDSKAKFMLPGTDADLEDARDVKEFLLGRREVMPNLLDWPL